MHTTVMLAEVLVQAKHTVASLGTSCAIEANYTIVMNMAQSLCKDEDVLSLVRLMA